MDFRRHIMSHHTTSIRAVAHLGMRTFPPCDFAAAGPRPGGCMQQSPRGTNGSDRGEPWRN